MRTAPSSCDPSLAARERTLPPPKPTSYDPSPPTPTSETGACGQQTVVQVRVNLTYFERANLLRTPPRQAFLEHLTEADYFFHDPSGPFDSGTRRPHPKALQLPVLANQERVGVSIEPIALSDVNMPPAPLAALSPKCQLTVSARSPFRFPRPRGWPKQRRPSRSKADGVRLVIGPNNSQRACV
jgi:hypothetical protein